MKNAILILAALLCGPVLRAQESTIRLTVLGYQWTATHRTLTFSWPGYSNTSCNGTLNINGNVSGGSIYASGTSSDTCSTTYTPPTTQNVDIQKPVVFILADTDTSRIIMTCTRNTRWSQCHALNPGPFLARNDHGHLEVQATSGKGKEEWVKFDIVQQTAISGQQAQSRQQFPAGKRSEAEANSWHTQKYCEDDGFIWIDGACHAAGFRPKSVSTTPQGVECPCDRYASKDPESCRKAWQCK